MFSFYREREKKYVVDFWKDNESTSINKATVSSSNKETAVKAVNEDDVNLKMSQKEVVLPVKPLQIPSANENKTIKAKKNRKVSNVEEKQVTADQQALLDKVKEELHKKLAALRVKYKDSETLDKMYIEKYKELEKGGKIFR